MKILISGGGTGGHVFPAIAIADALRRKDSGCEILFVGAKGKMEMEKVPQAGYNIKALHITGLHRNKIFANLLLPFKIFIAFFEALKIICQFKPHIVIGVGGYASFMVCRIAQMMSIPTVLLEQNAFAGKSNHLLSTRALCICTAFDEVKNLSKHAKHKIVHTGNPVRKAIAQNNYEQHCAKQECELDNNKLTLLVIGGSLGALNINKAIANLLPLFKENDIQLIWQTGKYFYQQAQSLSQTYPNVQIYAFIDDMAKMYAAADIIISRAGAIALAELCIVGKPTIFIPLPTAAENHQYFNAKILADHGAALLVEERNIQDLATIIINLINDKQQRDLLSNNIAQYGVRDADDKIAQQIIAIIK